jgi:hypothetical protein
MAGRQERLKDVPGSSSKPTVTCARAHTHTRTLLVLESDVAVKLLEPLLVDLHPPKHTEVRGMPRGLTDSRMPIAD